MIIYYIMSLMHISRAAYKMPFMDDIALQRYCTIFSLATITGTDSCIHSIGVQ